jgi:hypothetical protein
MLEGLVAFGGMNMCHSARQVIKPACRLPNTTHWVLQVPVTTIRTICCLFSRENMLQLCLARARQAGKYGPKGQLREVGSDVKFNLLVHHEAQTKPQWQESTARGTV